MRSPIDNSPRMISQTRITGIAKKDRKKTCSPAGTPISGPDVALTSAAIAVNTATLPHFNKIPRSG